MRDKFIDMVRPPRSAPVRESVSEVIREAMRLYDPVGSQRRSSSSYDASLFSSDLARRFGNSALVAGFLSASGEIFESLNLIASTKSKMEQDKFFASLIQREDNDDE